MTIFARQTDKTPMISYGGADQLIAALQNDSIDAFDALYKKHHQAVYRNICKLIHKYEIAEDILQEVFLSLWQHRMSLDPNQPIAGWLFVVSYNKSVNWIKKDIRENKALKKYPHLSVVQDQPQWDEQLMQAQLQAILKAADQLPLRKKQAFQLCRLEGKSYEEAGFILGISSDTVKDYVKTSSRFIRSTIFSQNSSSLAGLTAIALFVGL